MDVRRLIHPGRLPHLGQRIIKTGVAVFICLLIYWIRGFEGLVMQSTVAAIICIQPYRADSIQTSVNRVIGTLVGAGWAVLFLYALLALDRKNIHPHPLLVFLAMSLGVVITLYSTVLIRKTEAASLAAMVFICIVAAYPNYESPFQMTLDRIIDTIVGIVVAGIVNSITLPRKKHEEYLFFLRLHDLVPDRYSHASPTVLVMLNRLFEEGARICITSKWAPAYMISQMGGMNVNVPIIVMDGAALYDIPSRSYLKVISLAYKDVVFLRDFFTKMGLCYAAFAVRDSSLMIYRGGKINEAEKQEYELLKYSPYRNYMEGEFTEEDQICFIRIIDTNDIIEELESRIQIFLSKGRFRIVRRPQHRMEGCSGLYFYNPEATIENSKEHMVQYLEETEHHEVVPIDVEGPEHQLSENETIALLNKVRSTYEPLRLPGKKES